MLAEVAQSVRDPVRRVPVGTVTRDRAAATFGAGGEGSSVVIDDRLGGGSDYVVFLNHLGIPVADLAFEGAYGVYHSAYDTHAFVARLADPGFTYHAALVELWGLAAMRLAEADALPLDPEASARRIRDYLRHAGRRLSADLAPLAARLQSDANELQNRAAAFGRARDAALHAHDGATLAALNRQLLRFERAFLDPEGLPGRPWFRHVIYAPAYTYEPQMLPGLETALDARHRPSVERAVGQIGAALRRAAAQLDGW
jgi:N-acetylated-alpha-linked acidic dipeptidase